MNVRAKCSAVNSVFLVQLRKNSADDSRGFLVGQENCLSIRAMRWGVLFRWRAASGQNCLPRRGGLSTGHAQEMQKGSSQFSVRRCHGFLLRCRVVLGSSLLRSCFDLQELPERKLATTGREFLPARQILSRGGSHEHRSGMWNESRREKCPGTV